MDLCLEGNVALITGGASGIGLATAKAFAEEGCSIVLWDISSRVHEAVKELRDIYPDISVSASQFDLLDIEEGEKSLRSAVEQTGRIDHVVHCAAIGSGKFGFPFSNLTPADWRKTIEVNILGLTHLAHLVTPVMQEQTPDDAGNRGSVIVLASVAGQIGSQTDPPYSASKAANINFAQCMAKDLASHSIRVNTVCPGMVQTELNRSVWKAWHDQAPESERITYEEWGMRKIESVVPLRRWQSPDDIANMIVFLSSPRAAQITGQTINVDGGFVMHW